MFRQIRLALEGIASALRALVQAVHEQSETASGGVANEALEHRVAELERTLEARLAEAEGQFTKAESSRQAARNAEERARGMETRARKLDEIGRTVEGDDEEDPFEAAARAQQANGYEPAAELEQRSLTGRELAREAKRTNR